MNYEEKYKEALERMKSWVKGEHPECFSEAQKAAEFIFPELAENGDEKIRKEIIQLIQGMHDADPRKKRWIAWLEKQGDINETSAEWSEEDEKKRKCLIKGLEDRMGFGWASDPFSREEYIDWLKSLKPHKQWTPNTAQLIVIKDLIEDKNTSNVNKVILQGMLREIDDAYL